MSQRRYPAAREFTQICALTGTDPARVLRRARMPASFLESPARGVTAEVFFRLWSALLDEMGDPLAPLRLARAVADQEMMAPAARALVWSPDIATALERLALFKQVAVPARLTLTRTPDHVVVTMQPIAARVEVPTSFHLTHFAWLLALTGRLTGHPARALWTSLPDGGPPGLPPDFGERRRGPAMIALSVEDACRPIPSRDDAAWAGTEAELIRDLNAPLSARVRAMLRELLPAGESRAQTVAEELFLSQRTFQRQLAAEGTSFQALLEEVRADMARDYLAHTDLSTEEIAYLLAYRDTSSFYRAFQDWTGTTPGALRRAAA